ncbi:MAG TPA: hypothetical protein VGJ18_10195 [Gemmatimonadaceae bacterium]|jgi:phage protein D
MPATLYRLFFDNAPASRAQLDLVDRITVEQGIDVAWAARVEVPICTDAKGVWSDENASLLTQVRRVRVEVKVGDDDFVALIDGPVVTIESEMTATPGQSTATLVVSDDSFYLARNDEQARFDGLLDSEVADQLYRDATQIADTDIDDTTAGPNGSNSVAIQRGTAMAMIKRLARRNGMHAFVRPGDDAGASIGVFRSLPTKTDGLEPLVLLGTNRNLATFSAKNDGQSPTRTVIFTLNPLDGTTSSANASPSDADLLGGTSATAADGQVGTVILPPADGSVDPQKRADATATISSYAFHADGSVVSDCYPSILAPFRVVTVTGVDGRQSGDWLIVEVTHTLSRSVYTQSFKLARNATSAGSSAAATKPPIGIH